MSNPSITADKTPWYQWDTGLTVTLSGGEMTECHFANRKQGTAYVQAVINGVARVPDELLQVAAPIKAYGYVSDGAGGQTYVEQSFEVIARNIPSDYTYTKTAQKTILDAEAARDQAVQAAKDAKASELAAGDSAVEASKSAQSAGEYASAAATSASNAADAASAASGSASAAAQSATDASNSKAAAQTAKAEAEAAKSEAATSASNAATSATAAAKSASDAAASVYAINVIAPKTVDTGASVGVNGYSSVAIGSGSIANNQLEFSVGNDTLTREITHVSKPTADTSAATKSYVDTNTSNALVGNVSGKLLHVEDAWPGKPLSLTIDGAYKQDGTPSPEAPVPIVVIENPVLWVTGRNLLDVHEGMPESDCNKEFDNVTKRIIKPGTYAVGLTANNYYSNNVKNVQIGNGAVSFNQTAGGYGIGFGVSLVPGVTYKFGAQGIAEFKFAFYSADGTWLSQLTTTTPTVPTDAVYSVLVLTAEGSQQDVALRDMYGAATQITYEPYAGASLPITLPAEHPYLAALPDGTHDEIVIDKYGNASLVAIVGKTETAATDGVKATVGTDALSSTGALADGATVYYKLATPITYQLGKITVPSLPDSISNVWTDAELTTNMSMTYKRDINIAFDNLVQAVVAAAAGE